MKKLTTLLLILSILVTALPALAQTEAEKTKEEVIFEHLVAFNENLPPAYGTISIDDVSLILAERPDEVILLDVREVSELESNGYIEGAIHFPIRELMANLAALPDLDAEIIVICGVGARAMLAQTSLNLLGYENAKTMVGGFSGWVGADLPVIEGEMPAAAEMGEAPEFDEVIFEAVDAYLSNLPEGFGLVRAPALNEELIENPDILLIDVRSEEEWNDVGYLEGAEWVWINELMMHAEMLPEDLDAPIVIYCATSYRGGMATVMMNLLGYTNVRNLVGGVRAWLAEGLPVEGAPS